MKTKPPTIYEALKQKLGRDPTMIELKAYWDKILEECPTEFKKKGKRK